MAKKRVSIFEEPEVLDMTGFAPKSAADTTAPPTEQVRAVSETARFHSREATVPKLESQFKRPVRRYRTGRNVQFNVKALQETVDTIYDISESKGWVLGYTLQRAIEALKRELEAPP